MITSISKSADLLIMPRSGGEPDTATAKRLDAARKQPDSHRVEDSQHAGSQPLDRAVLDRAVTKVNEVLKSASTRVNLLVDQESEQVVVKVMKESGEVIRQFPPEEVLVLAKYLSSEQTVEPGKGVLLEERV